MHANHGFLKRITTLLLICLAAAAAAMAQPAPEVGQDTLLIQAVAPKVQADAFSTTITARGVFIYGQGQLVRLDADTMAQDASLTLLTDPAITSRGGITRLRGGQVMLPVAAPVAAVQPARGGRGGQAQQARAGGRGTVAPLAPADPVVAQPLAIAAPVLGQDVEAGALFNNVRTTTATPITDDATLRALPTEQARWSARAAVLEDDGQLLIVQADRFWCIDQDTMTVVRSAMLPTPIELTAFPYTIRTFLKVDAPDLHIFEGDGHWSVDLTTGEVLTYPVVTTADAA
jgi:hypothetical protein